MLDLARPVTASSVDRKEVNFMLPLEVHKSARISTRKLTNNNNIHTRTMSGGWQRKLGLTLTSSSCLLLLRLFLGDEYITILVIS